MFSLFYHFLNNYLSEFILVFLWWVTNMFSSSNMSTIDRLLLPFPWSIILTPIRHLGKKIEGQNLTLFHQGLNVISPGTNFFRYPCIAHLRRASYVLYSTRWQQISLQEFNKSVQVFDEFMMHYLSGFARKSTVKKYLIFQDSPSIRRRIRVDPYRV
jgi:hypothetical protein